MTTALTSIADGVRPISLAEMGEIAELHTRTDRKYIVDAATLVRLLDAARAGVAVLDIDGQRSFTYESVYFDTADLDLYRAAATGRRRRFKVRTRIYVDSGEAMLEVKLKNGRGQTVKHRLDHDIADRHRITAAGAEFVDDLVGHAGTAATLSPLLTTHYIRTTLVDIELGTRATIDRGLVCTEYVDEPGVVANSVTLDRAIIETKSNGPASVLDRWMWANGIRPVKISKFCTALAAMRPDLPANKWHRTLGRHFH